MACRVIDRAIQVSEGVRVGLGGCEGEGVGVWGWEGVNVRVWEGE